jgi:hypothetical protein
MGNKFQIIGNALVVTDTSSSEVLFDHPALETYYKSNPLINGEIILEIEDGSRNRVTAGGNFDLADSVDGSDTAFTEQSFRTFARINLG